MKVTTVFICVGLVGLAVAYTVTAQTQIDKAPQVAVSRGTRQEDGLNGAVRRVRIETAELIVKEGKTVEGPRVVKEITTYNPRGEKIDSVNYDSESKSTGGNKEFVKDARGNIIEMVLRGDDGSIMRKEKYDYQFDEFGNWKKMTASIAVYENGAIGYEPFEITYRIITYYFVEPATNSNISAKAAPPKRNPAATKYVGKPTDSVSKEPLIATKATSEVKQETNDTPETANKKPEPSESPNTQPAPVTKTHEAGRLPVIQVTEEVLRKAAIDLPQPRYPDAAMLSRAEGTVGVQLIVDEKGEVTKAMAVSGNPLFSEVAAEAARKAKFSPTALSREPARVHGVLTYTFSLPVSQPTESPAVTRVSNQPKTSDSNPAVSELRALQPSEVAELNRQPKSDAAPPALSLFEQGLEFLVSGKYAEAVEVLRRAAERDPNDAATYAKLGVAYAQLRQYQEAVIVLKMAIKIKPTALDAEAYFHLSHAYTALKKFSEALEASKQAIYIARAEQANPETAKATSFPTLGDLHYSTGLAYFNLRRYNAAIEELKQAATLKPNQAQIHYGLALSYLGYGDRKSADKQRVILESLDPVYAAKVTKLLAPNAIDRQGFGFTLITNP